MEMRRYAGVAALVLLAACGSDNPGAAPPIVPVEIAVSIVPELVTVSVGPYPFQFKVIVTGTRDSAVSWSLEQPAGVAQLDQSGVFMSGRVGTFRVLATSRADPSKSATAIVTVTDKLVDHGGPVVPVTRTFALWWGDPSAFAADARPAVEGLLQGLDGSPYFAIIDQYMRGTRAQTSFGGSLIDTTAPPIVGSQSVSDAACRALDANGITPQPGDFVFVNTANFSQDLPFCGLHSYTTCHGQRVLFAYIPNPAGTFCIGPGYSCGDTSYSGPATSLLLISAHELFEAVTDPLSTTWNSEGAEMGDRCGTPSCVTLTNGVFPLPNMYSNAAHGCVLE